jgi:hypothetical protein
VLIRAIAAAGIWPVCLTCPKARRDLEIGIMRLQRRWMRWIFEEVETFNTRMPWERGYARKGWKSKANILKLPRLKARA